MSPNKILLNKRNLVFCGLVVCVSALIYWRLPSHLVGSNKRIEALINRLASSNRPPTFSGDPPHFYLDEFLKNPGSWDPDAQKPVSDAYYELKSIGKEAFPYLIKHFNDGRYSHERSYSTFVSHTVGEACKFLIEEQIDPRGISYKTRESPNGTVAGYDVLFEAYVKSNYGSYASWWRNNQNRTLLEMRMAFCNWRINKEKQFGFIDEEQQNGMLNEFNEMLKKANTLPEEFSLPPPDWYTVDAIVMDIKLSKLVK